MVRITLFIVYFCSFLFAESFKEDKNLEVIAKNISMENDIVTATGDVVVYSPNKYITATKLIYDRNKSVMEFFDDVTVVEDGESTSFSDYLFIDTQKDLKRIKPSLLLEDSGEMWFNAKEVDAKDSIYNFGNSILSSCDCVDPTWNITATSGDYDIEEKWVNTYNTTLFIKGVPILYTPYFGFSTDKTRRSGILAPTVGYSSDEGLLYAQPLYYAPTIDFDLEFIPQVRYSRGVGYETRLRYVDSKYSNLEAGFGSFFEKDNYYKEKNLTKKRHDGWDIEYNRTKVLSKGDHSDGLKIDLVDMSDIDYQNTRYNDDISLVSNKTLTSLIKYYYNTNDYYGDIEFKKLKDLSKDDSEEALDTLPKINLHKYSNNIVFDDLTYSIDMSYDREERKTGVTAQSKDLTIPLTYTNSLFDDYLEFSVGEELNLLQIDYDKGNNIYTDGKYATLTHFAKVQTNLIKPYEDYLHTINLNATYKKPEEIQKKGDLYSVTSNASDLSVFPISKSSETILLNLNSSLYDNETLNQVINYKISQLYTYNDISNNYQKDDLSQNLRLHFGDFILSNDLLYSYDLDKIVLSSTTLDYTYKQSYFNIYYKYSKDKNTLDNQEDLVYTLGYKFDNDYTISYKEEIDLSTDISKRKEYILGIDKKCWALNFKVADNVVATDTINNSATRQKIVYIEFNFKQLFNMQQQYKSN